MKYLVPNTQELRSMSKECLRNTHRNELGTKVGVLGKETGLTEYIGLHCSLCQWAVIIPYSCRIFLVHMYPFIRGLSDDIRSLVIFVQLLLSLLYILVTCLQGELRS